MFDNLWLCLFYVTFLLSFSESGEVYDEEFCDEYHPSIYCTCDFKFKRTIMVCYFHSYMKKDDALWTAMSKVEDVVVLKLNSRLPYKLETIPIDSLRMMPYLEDLSVQMSNLGQLPSYAVSGLKVLRELEIENCEITGLQAHAIADLPRLKRLSLSDNMLQEILADSLTGLLDLQELFLDRNNISRIEGCAFCDLQNLRELAIWQNEITDLTEYMFRGLRYLKRLDISRNKIRLLNDKVFHSMPKLEELDLHSNLIDYISPRAFQGLEKLQRLFLHSNKIKTLPDDVFKSLPNLRSVDLYKNELETLQVEVLEHMDNIKDKFLSFDFSQNPLKCDCRLSWVKKLLQINESHFFTRDLQQLECTGEDSNETQIVYKLEINCSSLVATDRNLIDHQQKSIITTSRSIAVHPVDLIPYEIQKRTNKTAITEDVTEDVIISQDSEMEMEENMENKDSGSRAIRADFDLIVFVVLLTVFLVRKRKGTWF